MFVYPTERKKKTFQAPKRVSTAGPASKKTPATKVKSVQGKRKSTPTNASFDT